MEYEGSSALTKSAAEPDVSPLTDALHRLDKANSECREVVSLFIDALAPVLGPEPVECMAMVESVPAGSSDIVRIIRERTTEIENTTRHLHEARARLEV